MVEALNYSYAKYTKDKVDAIEVDTIDLQTQMGVAGLGLSAIPDMALNSTVSKEATAAKNATVAKTTELISGAAIDFGAAAKVSLETAVDNGLDNALAVPTAGSLAGIIKTGIPEIAPGSGDGLATHNDIIGLSGIRNTVFGVKSGAGVSYVAATWTDIFSDSTAKDRKIKGIKITNSAAPTAPVYRIVIGGVHAFPFDVAGNPVDSAVLKELDEPVVVESGSTYAVQVNCTVIGGTATLTELDTIELG